MASAGHDAHGSARDRIASRAALAVAVAGGVAIAAVGARLYLTDGSYFLDEAAVVQSLDELGAGETLVGPLAGGGQNFPRVYLLAIRVVRAVLGPSTWATRLLPHAFFLAATALWMRLLYLRFRGRPYLLVLAVPLLAIASSWWLYAAVVKPYSLDVLLVVALFSLPDAFFDERLRRGRGRVALLPLLAPLVLSYTYGIALVARVAGWYAFGLGRERAVRLDARAAGGLAAGFALGIAALFWTDLRHAFGQTALFAVWRPCIVGAGHSTVPAILDRFFLGWYTGPGEFLLQPALAPLAVDVLRILLLVGVARVAASVVVPAAGPPAGWGGRSLGCLAGVAGAVVASAAAGYPICAGRLTLFALFFQHVLLLEGVDLVAALVARASRLPWRPRQTVQTIAVAAFAGLVGAGALTAWRVADGVLSKAPLEDVRPLLPRLATAPDLPVVATNCMRRQIATLPEGVGDREVILLPAIGWEAMLPAGRDVWIFHSRLTTLVCERLLNKLRLLTDGLPQSDPTLREQAVLYRAHVLDENEARAKRRRALRAVGAPG